MFNMVDRRMKKRKSGPPRQHTGRPKSARRDSRGADWIYGLHAALAAAANPRRRTERILVTEAVAESHAAALTNQPVEVVGRADIEAVLPPDAVHQGIALKAPSLPALGVDDVINAADARETAVVVVLDQATDPRNVGAVLRSAAAFGAACVIVHDHHAPPVTGSLAKAASGALETVPLVRVANLAQAMNRLKDADFWCLGLDGGADTLIGDANLSGKTVLVFGAEGSGLRRLTRETCDVLVKIPIAPGMESLNLSNAVAVALYEAARRA